MILKYQSEAKTRTNERHDGKRGERGRNCEIQANTNQMIFYDAKYEHMMGSSGLIGFLQILKGLEAFPRTTSSSGSLREPCRYRGHKDRHADGRYFGLGFSEDYQFAVLATDNKKGHGILAR